MKDSFFLIFCFCLSFNSIFCYYSVKLNKIYLPVINSTVGENLTFHENNKSLDEYTELPLNYSELNVINESFLPTDNLNFEVYTSSLYIGSNKQRFKLVLSTKDDFTTLSSVDCSTCKVQNKYNSLLSTTKMNKTPSFISQNIKYSFIQDMCLLPAQRPNKEFIQKNLITIPKLNFKIIENDLTGFLNSNLSDGILGLNYANSNDPLNSNLIRELYSKGYISSPSFSLVITTSDVNRLYLGDIMKNEHIKQFIDDNMNKGECDIVESENNWKCYFETLEFNALKQEDWQKHSLIKKMSLTFDIKENRLTIPESYFNLIVVGYKKITDVSSHKYRLTLRESERIVFNKKCLRTVDGRIFCNCKDKDDFGVLSFYFPNGTLDIDIRDYVYVYNITDYKCRVDISLSKNDEFIVGLKGLNNTILSFNMEEKKIKFFHKKKKIEYSKFSLFTIIVVIALIVVSVILELNSRER